MTAATFLLFVGIAATSWSSQTFAKDTATHAYAVDRNENVASFYAQECVRYSDWTPTRTVESCDPAAYSMQAPEGRTLATTQGQASPGAPGRSAYAARRISR